MVITVQQSSGSPFTALVHAVDAGSHVALLSFNPAVVDLVQGASPLVIGAFGETEFAGPVLALTYPYTQGSFPDGSVGPSSPKVGYLAGYYLDGIFPVFQAEFAGSSPPGGTPLFGVTAGQVSLIGMTSERLEVLGGTVGATSGERLSSVLAQLR
jgi:hypothetical protein